MTRHNIFHRLNGRFMTWHLTLLYLYYCLEEAICPSKAINLLFYIRNRLLLLFISALRQRLHVTQHLGDLSARALMVQTRQVASAYSTTYSCQHCYAAWQICWRTVYGIHEPNIHYTIKINDSNYQKKKVIFIVKSLIYIGSMSLSMGEIWVFCTMTDIQQLRLSGLFHTPEWCWIKIYAHPAETTPYRFMEQIFSSWMFCNKSAKYEHTLRLYSHSAVM